jgi:phage terminase large subunit-like protein
MISAQTISALSQKLLEQVSPAGLEILTRKLSEVADQREKLLTSQRQLYKYYPDLGPLRRDLYPRHMAFFAAGGEHDPIDTWCPEGCDGSPHRERLALCANRVGKTVGMGGYETVLHLTGRYPAWWVGHRFDHPIEVWAAGKKNETTRDIIQKELFGPVKWNGRIKHVAGTGLIPAEDIGAITWKRGVADLIDTAMVRSKWGGWSAIGLKSYEQGRGAFEGTAKHLIWLDEECELDVYSECRIRLMVYRGHALLTFTPLEGMTQLVQAFLPGGLLPGETSF